MSEKGAPRVEREPDEPDLRSTAREALRFERDLLRRAWGDLYALFAVAFLTYYVLPSLVWSPLLAGATPIIRYSAIILPAAVATLVALPIAVLLFIRGERAYDLRRAASGLEALHRTRLIVVVVTIGLILVIGLFIVGATDPVLATLTGYVPLLYFLCAGLFRGLRRAFQPIPPEGWLAFLSAVAAIALTSLGQLLSIRGPSDTFQTIWIVVAIIWSASAARAWHRPRLRRSSDG